MSHYNIREREDRSIEKVGRKRRRSRTPSRSRTPRRRSSGQGYRKKRKVAEESPSKREILRQIKAMNIKLDIIHNTLVNGIELGFSNISKSEESSRAIERDTDKQCTLM